MIIEFLGGAAFRYLAESVMGFFNKRQDHAHELEMLKVQRELAAEEFERRKELAQVEGQLKLDQISADFRGRVEMGEITALDNAIQAASRPLGIKWVDAWNGSIRPFVMTALIAFYGWHKLQTGATFDAFDQGLLGVVVGFYFAARSLLPGKK